MSFWTNIYKAPLRPPVASKTVVAPVIVILAACLLTLGAGIDSAHAAQPSKPQPSKQELRTFKRLVKEGSALRKEGKLWEAIGKFEQARTILDHPKLAFSIGKLHQKTGACEQARDTYADVLANDELPDDLREEVVREIEGAETCESFSTLSLTCAPAKAQVRLESKSLRCPLRQKLAPGDLQVVVSAPGHAEKSISATLEPGQLFEEHVELSAADSPAAGRVPPPGEAEESSWMRYTAYGSIGVGAALLAGGLASDYSAQTRADEFVAANQSGDRERAQALKGEADDAQLRTVVLYSAGTVLVGGGIALWAIDAQDEGDDAATVRTELGWGPAGPTVRGVLRW